MLDNNDLVLKPIAESDVTSKLSLGHPNFVSLKNFLKNDAFDFHSHEIAKTFVLSDSLNSIGRVWGYVTLMTSEVLLTESQRPSETFGISKYKTFSAAKLARLAIDKRLQGQGYGQSLLDWSVNHIQFNIMPHIGCRFLVVDSKLESVPFYTKHGFVFLEGSENLEKKFSVMFFDLYKTNLNLSSKVQGYANNKVVTI